MLSGGLDYRPAVAVCWVLNGAIRRDEKFNGTVEVAMTDVGPEALDLLTVGEVAARLRCSVKTVRRLVYAWNREPGTGLESVKLGTLLRVAPEAVIDYKKRLQAAQAEARKGAA